MSRNLEGVHVGFLRHAMGLKSKRQRDRTWRSAAAARVLNKAGTQTLGTYIDKRQVTVAKWVALIPILEICDRETDYEVGERHHKLWWQKTVARKQLSETLKEILAAARARRW